MKKINITGASWDSIFLAFTKALTMLFGILTAKILSVGLTLEGYGTYSQANLVMTTGTSIILMGLGDALSYYFNNNDKRIDESLKARIVNTVFFLEIALGATLAVAIVVGQLLSQEEMSALIDDLFNTSMPSHTPDGKPVIHIMNDTEIDRNFMK